MNTVITINLNARAYQVENAGYEKLREYLESAKRKLGENPDKNEIMNDLEQAIGDKAQRFISPYKNVILVAEIETILAEMGPVETNQSDEKQQHTSQNESSEDEKEEQKSDSKNPKKLYLIREGAYITGVCNGFAAYFDIDVTWMRIIFIGLTLITQGAWILVYIVLSLVIPYANTSEEKAFAHGQPFNAQELISRAKEKYAHFDKKYWNEQKKEWKQWAKHHSESWQGAWQKTGPRVIRAGVGIAGVMVVILMTILAVAWLVGIISLLTTGALFGFIFVGVPLWVALLIVTFAYHIATLPLRAFRNESYVPTQQYGHHHMQGAQAGWSDMWDAMMWLVFFILIGWLLWTFVPATHVLWERFSHWFASIFNNMP